MSSELVTGYNVDTRTRMKHLEIICYILFKLLKVMVLLVEERRLTCYIVLQLCVNRDIFEIGRASCRERV